MQKIFVLLLASIFVYTAGAQNVITVLTKDSVSKELLPGVNISLTKKNGTLTDKNGLATLLNIPLGTQTISFSHTGYTTVAMNIYFPLSSQDTLVILMTTDNEDLDEVVVQSTRTGRTIKNTPTRIETIDGEELDEKNNMRPANISMLLHESTGLQVQQTSAATGNASIRMQGLDGRYTQLLKDGYPTFGNFASGLSILEIPPLDLKQVEVIKGPASTLYGGGAIAGVVNLISKTPKEKFEGDFIFNQSHIGQTNLGAYGAQKSGRWGYTLLGTINLQKEYDVDKDGFSEVPQSHNFTINPQLFYYPNSSTTIWLGNSFTKGTNIGGDMEVIKNRPDTGHTYFEKNNTIRNTTTLGLDKKFENNNALRVKQSVSIFDRHIFIPGFTFSGTNVNSFTDLSMIFYTSNHTVISGVNLVFDKFKHENDLTLNAQSFAKGIYLQDTWDITSAVKMESGFRIDHVQHKNSLYNKSQVFALPRVSILFKMSDQLSSRISGGLGYKVPTIFTEQTESMQYRNVLPSSNVNAEKSIGGTADISFKTTILENLEISINEMLFYTRIRNPLVLQPGNAGDYYFANAAKPTMSYGIESNWRLIYKKDLKLFVGYTLINAKAGYLSGNQFLPLLPKSKVNLALMYEKEDHFKLGLESYFTGPQTLYNGNAVPSFWEFGFMAQKTVNKISLYVNFENFTDQRQSKYKTVVNPPHNAPVFDDIWNHTEGFVVNGGIKLKL
ncbi:MAG: TonB-dependent receptor [Ferruginibacter sp.]|nr:TonB-dependent receptor [Ferruginibacter sp.]